VVRKIDCPHFHFIPISFFISSHFFILFHICNIEEMSGRKNEVDVEGGGKQQPHPVTVSTTGSGAHTSSTSAGNGGATEGNNSLYYLCPMHWFKSQNMSGSVQSGTPGSLTSSPPTSAVSVSAPPTGTCPISGKKAEAGVVVSDKPAVSASASACPVKHVDSATVPSAHANAPSGSACPVQYKNKTAYNVYSQPLDPSNQMPAIANQQPAPGQQEELDVNRVQSTIPKGGTSDTWTYPSPQMVPKLCMFSICLILI
jgi:hypothetical protein